MTAPSAKLTRLAAGHSPCHQDYPVAVLCLPNGSVAVERQGRTTPLQRRLWAAALRELANQLRAENSGRPVAVPAAETDELGDDQPAEAAAGA